MKKMLSLLLVLSLMLGYSAVYAGGMGVQIIGRAQAETEPVSLDDIKLNVEVEIDGYAIICPKEFQFSDRLGYYRAGRSDIYSSSDYYQSGADADYAILRMDITNTAKTSQNFLSNCEVKVIYDNSYEYAGSCWQSNYDNKVITSNKGQYGEDVGQQNLRWAINDADLFSIDPMYQGHYIFSCKLPNIVVNSKKPLKMIITIDGNEIIYNIRK